MEPDWVWDPDPDGDDDTTVPPHFNETADTIYEDQEEEEE